MGEINLGDNARLTAGMCDMTPFRVIVIEAPKLRPKAETGFESDTWDLKIQMPDGKRLTFGMGVKNLLKIAETYTLKEENWISKGLTIQKIPSSMAKSGFSLFASAVAPGASTPQVVVPDKQEKLKGKNDLEAFV